MGTDSPATWGGCQKSVSKSCFPGGKDRTIIINEAMNADPLSILLICNAPRNNAQTILDHVSAFSQYSRNTIYTLSIIESIPGFFPFSAFDVLVVHYSKTLVGWLGCDHATKERIRGFGGLKVAFAQDEYRQVNSLKQELERLGIDILFSCVPTVEIPKVYGAEETRPYAVYNTLTGYVPESLKAKSPPPTARRVIDVGYRGRINPYYLGELAQEKLWIAEGFLERAKAESLSCDIAVSESERLYGKEWIRFLSSCKTVLGTESGASVFDFTGEIEKSEADYRKLNKDAGFFEVREKFFAAEEGKISLNQVSPRIFEAICLKTGLVLFEGAYSNIIEPWTHFLPLKKDFSNFETICRKIRDSDYIQKMVDRTFRDVACQDRYSYRRFIAEFDDIIEGFSKKRSYPESPRRLSMRRFIWYRRIIKSMILVRPRTLWNSLPNRLRESLRPFVSAVYPRVAKPR